MWSLYTFFSELHRPILVALQLGCRSRLHCAFQQIVDILLRLTPRCRPYAFKNRVRHLSLGQIEQTRLDGTSTICCAGIIQIVLAQIEVLRLLHLLQRRKQRLGNQVADIGSGESFSVFCQIIKVGVVQFVHFLPKMDLEHRFPCLFVRQGNVDSLLEATTQRRVDIPRLFLILRLFSYHVGRTQHQNPCLVLPHSVHLHQKLRQRLLLPAATGSSLRLKPQPKPNVARTAQRIDFIDENHRRFVLPSQLEEILHQTIVQTIQHALPSRFSLPLTHKICRRHGHECTVRLRGHCLGQIGFTRSRRTVE